MAKTRLNQSSLLILLLVLLLSISLIFFFIKTQILSAGDLVINIEPMHKSIELYHNEAKDVLFSISPENRYLCKSKCSYWLTDTSIKSVIDYETITIGHNREFTKAYEFYAPKFGSGQKVYNFNIKCSNIKSFLCPVRTPEKYKTAIVTVNYKLTGYEEYLKLATRTNLTNALFMLRDLDIFSQKLDNEIGELNSSLKIYDVQKRNYGILQNLSKLSEKVGMLRSLWEKEDYAELNRIVNPALIGEISAAQEEVDKTETELLGILERHNKIAEWILENKKRVKDLIKLIENVNKEIAGELISEINYLVDASRNLSEKFVSGNFKEYGEIEGQISVSDAVYGKLLFNESKRFAEVIGKGNLAVEGEYEAICNVKGYCINHSISYLSNSIEENLKGTEGICRKISLLPEAFSEANDRFLLEYSAKNYGYQNLSGQELLSFLYNKTGIRDYLNDDEFSALLNSSLRNKRIEIENQQIGRQNEKIKEYNRQINQTNNRTAKANTYISAYNMGNLSTDECNRLINAFNKTNEFFEREFILERLLRACNSTIEKIEIKAKEGKSLRTSLISTPIIGQIGLFTLMQNTSLERVNISNESIKNLSFDTLNIAIKLNHSETASKFYDENCYNLNTSILKREIRLFNYTLEGISTNPLRLGDYKIITRINTSLKENFPVCCFFGTCNICCYNKTCDYPSLIPVIFVHGHAFNKEDSPDYSLDGFDKLQKIFYEGGYIDGGIILPISKYSDIGEGEWGVHGRPVVVKTSYYYNVYGEEGQLKAIPQTSENITTYARRLKEIVDIVKYRTGKSKVNIIAHSMGGLVARKYLQIYGEDSVYKLIMIGTPNFGLRGEVIEFCPVTGEKKECEDMSAGSAFLKKLSNFVPRQTKMSTITGVGCAMGYGDGDGVVLSRDSSLPYAKDYKIEGNCSFTNLLHVEMLDTNKYPKAYSVIKEILSK